MITARAMSALLARIEKIEQDLAKQSQTIRVLKDDTDANTSGLNALFETVRMVKRHL